MGTGKLNPRTSLAVLLPFPSSSSTAASSASSEISSNLRFRREELDEFSDPVDGSAMVDMLKADSVSSDAAVKEKTVSCGVKVSSTD